MPPNAERPVWQDVLTVNSDIWDVVRNSMIFAIGLVPMNMALALTLAMCRPVPGVVFFRVGFFAPAVAWTIVWKFLLQSESGAANQLLATVGINGPNWLREPD